MIEISNVELPLDALLPGNEHILTEIAAERLDVSLTDIARVQLFKKSVDARKKSNVHFVVTLRVSLVTDSKEIEAMTRGQNTATEETLATVATTLRDAGIKDEDLPIYGIPEHKGADANVKYQGDDSAGDASVLRIPPKLLREGTQRPIVVGSGPAGLFAALLLARAGLKPLLVERGASVDERVAAVDEFNAGGAFNAHTNIQFGEGGAGTFSDGKLTTNTKNPLTRVVLEWFVEAGAPEEILVEAKPHIGTDKLRDVVKNIREQIVALGGEVRFYTQLVDFTFEQRKLSAVTLQDVHTGARETISATHVVLATGHSARDTFALLRDRAFALERKPFSMGVRIEHPQGMIDEAQYGTFAGHSALSAADYKLSTHLKNGRGVYTFCMCPGGQVVAGASEEGGVVVNGMSTYARDGKNANSAVLVSVEPSDFSGDDVLAGVEFQRTWERAAYELAQKAGGAPYAAPAQHVGDFLASGAAGKVAKTARAAHRARIAVEPSYPRGVAWCDLHECLPSFVSESLEQALPQFDARIRGFANPNAVMTGVETRSSSPVRVVRGRNLQAAIDVDTAAELQQPAGARDYHSGVYPCGEGAGYAGGIMSAAVDGLRVAQALCADVCIVTYPQLLEKETSTPAGPARKNQQGQMFLSAGDIMGEALFAHTACPGKNDIDAEAKDDIDPAIPERTCVDETGCEYDYRVLKSGKACITAVRTPETTLCMPTFIEGRLISQLDGGAFSGVKHIEDLTLSAGLAHLGKNVLKPLVNLKRLALPDAMKTMGAYDLHWVSHFERVALPALMPTIKVGFLGSSVIDTLVIGRNVRSIVADAFNGVTVGRIEVDPDNLWFYTDGKAIYSKEDDCLVLLVVSSEEYVVDGRCRRIGRKAFTASGAKRVMLPKSVEVIDSFAFFRTPLERFTAPANLRVIGLRAFFQCEQLRQVELNEGLEEIGEEAFSKTNIAEIALPCSLKSVGSGFVDVLRAEGGELLPRVTISAENPFLLCDAEQGIYRKTSDGLTLEGLANDSITSYELLPACIEIAPFALKSHRNLVELRLSEQLRRIGKGAFQGCTKLRRVGTAADLRQAIARSGENPDIVHLCIPEHLDTLNDAALILCSSKTIKPTGVICDFEVHPQNKWFFIDREFLMQRLQPAAEVAGGDVVAVVFFGAGNIVEFPDYVTDIASNCLASANRISEIVLCDGVRHFSANCFRAHEKVDAITVNFNRKTFLGYRRLSFMYSANYLNAHDVTYAFLDGELDVPLLYECSDRSIMRGSPFQQFAFVGLSRLENPLFLDPTVEEIYRTRIKNDVIKVVVDFAEQGYLRGFDMLIHQGFLTADNIVRALDAARDVASVETMAYLLELRRTRFGHEEKYSSRFDL